jgi:hypothetical protein
LEHNVLPFLGSFFNEPIKSSLIGEKLPNLVTLPLFYWKKFISTFSVTISLLVQVAGFEPLILGL